MQPLMFSHRACDSTPLYQNTFRMDTICVQAPAKYVMLSPCWVRLSQALRASPGQCSCCIVQGLSRKNAGGRNQQIQKAKPSLKQLGNQITSRTRFDP